MTTNAPPPFAFPREYYFPPFFTRQTNLTTHHAQLTKWSTLVLTYCRHYRIFKLSLSGDSSSSASTSAAAATSSSTGAPSTSSTEELFFNKKLDRRLSVADIKEVVEFMRKVGRAEYIGSGSSGGAGGDVVWVYWRTPEEWAALIEGWVEDTAQKGSVLTLYELTEGDSTLGTGEWPPSLSPPFVAVSPVM